MEATQENVTINRSRIAALVVGLLVAIVGQARGEVTIAGYSFADNAFPDVLISQFGTFSITGAPDLAGAVLGADLNSYARGTSYDAHYTVGYTDNIVRNVPGPDIAFFELWIEDNFHVEINGVRRLVNTQYNVGQGPHGTLNIGLVDLDDFGLPPGAMVDRVTLWVGSGWSPSEYTPTMTVVGAAIPEPATTALLMVGSGLMMLRRKRRS